jgi:hypothetical protein
MLRQFMEYKMNDFRGKIIKMRQGIANTMVRSILDILTEKHHFRAGKVS